MFKTTDPPGHHEHSEYQPRITGSGYHSQHPVEQRLGTDRLQAHAGRDIAVAPGLVQTGRWPSDRSTTRFCIRPATRPSDRPAIRFCDRSTTRFCIRSATRLGLRADVPACPGWPFRHCPAWSAGIARPWRAGRVCRYPCRPPGMGNAPPWPRCPGVPLPCRPRHRW